MLDLYLFELKATLSKQYRLALQKLSELAYHLFC